MGLTVLDAHAHHALERLPAEVFDYFASGAGAELTVAEAERAWQTFRLLPRVLRDVGTVDLRTELLGDLYDSPIGIAPAGFQGLAHTDAELAVAEAAGRTRNLYVVSTRASRPLEHIAARIGGPWWFQVYVMRDRALTQRLVERAVVAGARALVVTGDTPLVGIKRRVGSTRIAIPDDHFLVNLEPHVAGVAHEEARAAAEQDPTVTFEVVEWLNRISGLPVLVKGVLRPDDATRCLDAGAAGVVVSNHGGRQLDRSLPSALALAGVVDAVGDAGTVLVDGGIRSGLDALVALALGARGVLVGRPVVWGLAADGATGVEATLRTLDEDLAHVMALVGAPAIRSLDRSLVVRSVPG